jgi:putative transposase
MVPEEDEEPMKKSLFLEAQRVKILREADAAPVAEIAKKHGISDATIYAWAPSA